MREARNKGLINRRALARYIAEHEKIPIKQSEALIMALRRHPQESLKSKDLQHLIKNMRTSAKDNIAIICLKNSEAALEKLAQAVKSINHAPSETFKIVQSSLSIKIFLDKSRAKQIKEIFDAKDIIEARDNIAEIDVIFPHDAIETRGIVSYVSAELAMNKINVVELLTSTPELLIYVDNADLLAAYEVIKSL
ncbi:MAG: hypothetical protein KKE71_06050 [Nanoarchaeota archaeon]|nr:hypothetical protein [Nanoarchaeota archaeon]MBU4452566.1 hypothetical protein [Nanoarchaeota archaeon]